MSASKRKPTRLPGRKSGAKIRHGLALKPLGMKETTTFELDVYAALHALQRGVANENHLVSLYVLADLAERIGGARSGLWREMARIIGEVLPRFVFVENSPLLVGRGAAVVIGDLAALGYDAHWACISASDQGAPHQRDRFWLVGVCNASVHGFVAAEIGCGLVARSDCGTSGQKQASKSAGSSNEYAQVADSISHGRNARRNNDGEHDRPIASADGEQSEICHTSSERLSQRTGKTLGRSKQDAQSQRSDCKVPDTDEIRPQGEWSNNDALGREDARGQTGLLHGAQSGREFNGWPTEPDVGRVANGVAARVDRLKAIGNGQVPRVAATAFHLLSRGLA